MQAAPVHQPHIQVGSPLSYDVRPNAYRRGYGGKHWRGGAKRRGYGGLRGLIWRRDKGRCQECGEMCVPKDAGGEDRSLWPHIDHIIPKSQGGTDDPKNLRLLCGGCNAAKRDREPGGGGQKS